MSKSDYYNRQNQSLAVIPQGTSISLAPNAAKAYALAETIGLRNELMAALAKQTLDNTAFLAKREFECLRDAPEGAAEYRRIVRGYANAAIELLWGGMNDDDV